MGFGAIAGISISKFGVLPMVATLALRYIMRGMAKGVSGVGTVTFSSPALTDFFNMKLFDKIPIHLLILILAVVIVYILVNRMSFGGYIEAYGENSKAAGICGINAVKIILVCYCMSAAFSWMAGMLDMISVSSANPANIGTDSDVRCNCSSVGRRNAYFRRSSECDGNCRRCVCAAADQCHV